MKKVALLALVCSAVVGCGAEESLSSNDQDALSAAGKKIREGTERSLALIDQMKNGRVAAGRITVEETREDFEQSAQHVSEVENEALRDFYSGISDLRIQQVDLYDELLDALEAQDFKAIQDISRDEADLMKEQRDYISEASQDDFGLSEEEARELLGQLSAREDELRGDLSK